MKAIITGANADPHKWEAARKAYQELTETYGAERGFWGYQRFSVTARRDGDTIIINVHGKESSK